MRPELSMLVLAVVLTFAQMLIAVVGASLQVGLPMLASNRENMPALTGWARRAQRAHLNMLESLVLFAVLILVAQYLGRTNEITRTGAQIFFAARLVYAFLYI